MLHHINIPIFPYKACFWFTDTGSYLSNMIYKYIWKRIISIQSSCITLNAPFTSTINQRALKSHRWVPLGLLIQSFSFCLISNTNKRLSLLRVFFLFIHRLPTLNDCSSIILLLKCFSFSRELIFFCDKTQKWNETAKIHKEKNAGGPELWLDDLQ